MMNDERRYEKKMMRRKRFRTKDGFVLCDNCDTPASVVSFAVDWFGCGACIFGDSSEIIPSEFIPAPKRVTNAR